MQRRKIRELVFRQPAHDDVITSPAASPREGVSVRNKVIGGGIWRRASASSSAIMGTVFINADLTTTGFESVTLDTCHFIGCEFGATTLRDIVAKDVIFEDCRLTGTSFANVRAVGPIAFLGCTLDGASFDQCRLGNAIFDRCSLDKTAFTRCDMHGCDVRGNDLSSIVGVTNARGLVVTADQLPSLTLAMAAELDFTIKEPPEPNTSARPPEGDPSK